MDRKKLVELLYLEEARRVSALLPSGSFIPHESPDFLLPTATGTIGVELTELSYQGPRREGARLGYVAQKARRIYGKRVDAKPVDVSPVFSRDAGDLTVDELASSLASFVFEHRDSDNNFSWNRPDGLPRGYSQIGVFKPLDSNPDGDWRYFRAFETKLAPKELLDARIAEKNQRLPAYRKNASEVWLLIVNDLFLGPGEVCVRADDLARRTFDFDFDEVLLFERQPGGTGLLTKLRHDSNAR